MHMDQTRSGSSGSAVIVGFLIGAVAGFGVAGVAGYTLILKKARDVRRGWNLVPVVVVSQDLPEGSTVTFDVLSQRPVPEQFVTDSVVMPNRVSELVGHRLTAPMKAGDLLLWSELDTAHAATASYCNALWSEAVNKDKLTDLKARLDASANELGLTVPASANTQPATGEAQKLNAFQNAE